MKDLTFKVYIDIIEIRLFQKEQVHISQSFYRKEPFRLRRFITIRKINVSKERAFLIGSKD